MNKEKLESKKIVALNNIQEIFSKLNSSFFSNSLKPVPMSFCESKTGFNFSKNFLFLDSSIFFLSNEEILIRLFHEMIHISNFQHDLKDVGTNSYHKKSFMSTAVEKGFYVARHKTQGWCLILLDYPRNVTKERNIVKPKEAHVRKRIESFNEIITNFDWNSFFASKLPIVGKKNYTYKYECACPSMNSIRSGRNPNGPNPLKAKCLVCDSLFACSYAR